MMWAFVLALIVGILGFEFMNFVLPPGEAVESGADLLAGNIFRQSPLPQSAAELCRLPFHLLDDRSDLGLGLPDRFK